PSSLVSSSDFVIESIINCLTEGSGSESVLDQWSLFTVLGISIPDLFFASTSSLRLNSKGLLNSTPWKPRSFTNFSLSNRGISSFIIPNPSPFLSVGISGLKEKLSDLPAKGAVSNPPANREADLIKSLLIIVFELLFKLEDRSQEQLVVP